MSIKKNRAEATVIRRDFLEYSTLVSGAAMALPTFVPETVFGANAPSNRITINRIGTGS